MQNLARCLGGVSLISLLIAPAFGALTSNEVLLHRDRGLEESLRQESTADQAITPAKVFRWIRSFSGHALTTVPSNTEFQPIVNVYNGQVRVIAAVNYKF